MTAEPGAGSGRAPDTGVTPADARPRRRTSLFWKYFSLLFAAVVVPLLIAGAAKPGWAIATPAPA